MIRCRTRLWQSHVFEIFLNMVSLYALSAKVTVAYHMLMRTIINHGNGILQNLVFLVYVYVGLHGYSQQRIDAI